MANFNVNVNERPHGKANNLHRRKQPLSSVTVQAGLCQTWLEPKFLVFSGSYVEKYFQKIRAVRRRAGRTLVKTSLKLKPTHQKGRQRNPRMMLRQSPTSPSPTPLLRYLVCCQQGAGRGVREIGSQITGGRGYTDKTGDLSGHWSKLSVFIKLL